jgi:hypothetical protein
MPDRPIWRRHARVFALVLLSLLTASLFAVVLRQSWTTNSANTRFVADQRHRVAYLRPLAHLVGALTEAQSAAVRDAPVDTKAVQSAVDAIDAVDREYRDALGTRKRWADLRDRVNATVERPGSGHAAYDAFSGILTLALDLVRRVGDTSDQILDPQLDSFYIMDAALLHLPRVMVSAGRAADLATLPGRSTLTGDDAIRVAVARHDVAQAAADASAGLTRSVEATGHSALGADLAGQLDGFRAAVDVFAPSVVLDALTEPVDVDSLPPAAGSVRVTALALGDTVLSELDTLLADREAGLVAQRQVAVGAGAGVVIALSLLVWLAWAAIRRARRHPSAGDVEAVQQPQAHLHERAPSDLVVDARDLLDFDELAHVGRTLRARHRGSGDNAG